MKKITFVCLGNICRSPMAEFVMRDLLSKAGLDFEVLSAGTSGEHDGENMHFKTRKKLESVGIKAENFTSKKLTQKLCDESFLIIVMDNANFKSVLKNFKVLKDKLFKMTDFAKDLGYDEVPDPWYSGDFDETYTIISTACNNLFEKLKDWN